MRHSFANGLSGSSTNREWRGRRWSGGVDVHRLGVVVLVAFLDREVVIRIVVRIVSRLGNRRLDELGLGLGVDLFRLFDHRGRDDEGLRVVFFPALLLGDARIGSHGVAEHGIEVNCFEPSGQLGRRLDVLLPEEAHGI